MDFLKRTGFSLMAVFSVFGLTACTGSDNSEKDLEALFPKDSVFVGVIDGSQKAEVGQFKELINSLPETGLWEKIAESYDDEMSFRDKSSPKYEETIKPIIEGEWKFGVAVKSLPQDIDATQAMKKDDFDKSELYIAGKFSEADKVEELIGVFLKDAAWTDLKTSEEGGVKYWTAPSQEFYVARNGDFFVITVNDADRKTAMKRLEEGGGLDENDEFFAGVEELEAENLAYAYVNGDAMEEFMQALYAELKPDLNTESLSVGDFYMVAFADDNGIVTRTTMDLPEANEVTREIFGNFDYDVDLINRVNGEGMFAYTEQPQLGIYVGAFLQGLSQGMQGLNSDDVDPFGKDYVKFFADTVGVTEEVMEGILQSPFAFAMSDIGTLYPTISFYLQLDEDYVEDARALTVAMDQWVDQVIAEYDASMEGQGFGVGALKKEVELVGGNGLHKLYFDLSSFPPDVLSAAAFIPDLDIAALKIEFYYGITADNMFVFAFYPDFAAAYGKNVLSGNAEYEKAIGKVNEPGYMVSYFASKPLIDLMDRWVGIAKSGGFMTEADAANYEKYVKGIVGAIKYGVSSSVYEDGAQNGQSYLWIKE